MDKQIDPNWIDLTQAKITINNKACKFVLCNNTLRLYNNDIPTNLVIRHCCFFCHNSVSRSRHCSSNQSFFCSDCFRNQHFRDIIFQKGVFKICNNPECVDSLAFKSFNNNKNNKRKYDDDDDLVVLKKNKIKLEK